MNETSLSALRRTRSSPSARGRFALSVLGFCLLGLAILIGVLPAPGQNRPGGTAFAARVAREAPPLELRR